MKKTKKKNIDDYIHSFNSILFNVKSEKENIEKIYKLLIKYQKKTQFMFLEMVVVPLLHLISVWI